MPVYRLDDTLAFPPADAADRADGLLAIGGDLSVERLLLAYRSGIFPWTAEGDFIPWYSPPWRMMLAPSAVRVSRSLARVLRRGDFEVRYDTAFDEVMAGCAEAPRAGQDGTWITAQMQLAYRELHRLGHAHSAEAWRGGELAGGLYGVTVGAAFCGESMFARRTNASKVAFVTLLRALDELGYTLVDCQVYTPHLASLGATEWPRRAYLRRLRAALARSPTAVWPEAERPGPEGTAPAEGP
jgi:leucyl/phenylalanyl-tRNA--protein transferase